MLKKTPAEAGANLNAMLFEVGNYRSGHGPDRDAEMTGLLSQGDEMRPAGLDHVDGQQDDAGMYQPAFDVRAIDVMGFKPFVYLCPSHDQSKPHPWPRCRRSR